MTLDSLECEWLFVEAEWTLSVIDWDDAFVPFWLSNWLCNGLMLSGFTITVFGSLLPPKDMLLLWWLPFALMTSKLSSFLKSICFVVPFIAAIGLGMLVTGCIIAFGWSCGGTDPDFVSVLISTFRTICCCCFVLRSFCWLTTCGCRNFTPFCNFKEPEGFSTLTSTVFTLSFLSGFDVDALMTGGGRHETSLAFFELNNFEAFDKAFAFAAASFFLHFDGAGRLESLFKLRLESLRHDEKPLLELVRFDVWDFERSLSLLKSFSLSSIECFVVPFCCCCAGCAISIADSEALLFWTL